MSTPKINFYFIPGAIYSTMVMDGKGHAEFIKQDMLDGKPIQLEVDPSDRRKSIVSVSMHSGERTLNIDFKPTGSPFNYHEERRTSYFYGQSGKQQMLKRVGKQQMGALLEHLRLVMEDVCNQWKIDREVNCLIVLNNYVKDFKLDCELPGRAPIEVFQPLLDQASEWYLQLPEHEKTNAASYYLKAIPTATSNYEEDGQLSAGFLRYLVFDYSFRSNIMDYVRRRNKPELVS